MTLIEPSPFGILLRERRVEAGLTQEELAERARVSARVVSDLERGVSRTPRLHTVRQLADALSLSSDDRVRFTTSARKPVEPSSASVALQSSNFDAGAREMGSTHLRTFLIADIRGYTRFTQEHGDEAAAALAAKFARLTRHKVEVCGGTLLELRGDEALCVFASARQAIRTAVELQEQFAADAKHEPNLPLAVGIGLDAGEAVQVEGGYRGDALNLASRLQGLAGSGEVLVSEGLVHLARKVDGFVYVERGLIELKGFSQPVRVMEVVPATEVPEDAAGDSTSTESERRLPIGGFLGALPAGPMVSRDDELDRILSVVEAVQSGAGRLVLLSGEEGVGKTRIAQEVTLRLRDREFLVAAGRCYQSRAATAFYPFLEAVPPLYRASSISIQSRVTLHWPQLARLVPEDLPTPSSTTAVSGEDHHRLFTSVAGFLSALSEESSVALLFDDLQWADEDSLELLHHLAREMSVRNVLLLATYRDGDVDRDTALDRVLRNLGRERLAERVPIRRLSREGTGSLVAATIGETETSDDFVDFVHRRTKGNPFFINRVLQTLGGRYRLIRQIGAGGMGRVFEAFDVQTGERVAAKLMMARTEADSHALQRFEQEGQVLAKLRHPNIVDIHGSFLDEHVSCIIMELLGGQSLGHLLGEREWTLAEIKDLMAQVTAALDCAHSQGIAHRDIKPDNIMVANDGAVKVTDFGIARMLRPIDTAASMTSTGMSMGTPLYVAPEQIRGQKVDGRADLYSLGAVLYQLVTGRPPFDGEDALTLGIQHLQQRPTPPSKLNPALPKDWETLILKALAKDPAQRYQTAKAMKLAIQDLSASGATAPAMSTLSTNRALPTAEAGQVHPCRFPDALSGPLATGSRLDGWERVPWPRWCSAHCCM